VIIVQLISPRPVVDWPILAGRNATEAFEDIGHSPDARELQQQYLIGETAEPAEKSVQVKTIPTAPEPSSNSCLLPAVFALVLAIVVVFVYRGFYDPIGSS